MSNRIKPMPKGLRGQSLVEFTLILPVLVLILMGIVDLGRGIYAYNLVAQAAREGARFASVRPLTLIGSVPNSDEVTAKALATLVGLDLSPSLVSVTYQPPMDDPLCPRSGLVQVTVNYTFQPIVTALFPTLTMSSSSSMCVE